MRNPNARWDDDERRDDWRRDERSYGRSPGPESNFERGPWSAEESWQRSSRPMQSDGSWQSGGYDSSSMGASRTHWNPGAFSGGSPNYDTEPRRGRNYGKGPKGYVKSDERIREDVCDCLTEDGDIDASDVDVAVRDGEVTLTGTVSERSQKRRIEDLCEQCSGVKDVHNSLRVESGTTDSSARSSSRESFSNGSSRIGSTSKTSGSRMPETSKR